MREIRKGKRFTTVHGEMYQHHDVWIPALEEWVVNQWAVKYEMDENHIIGKIVEDWVNKNATLEDRIKFFKEITLPKLREKYSNKEKEKEVERKDGESKV